MPDTTSKLAFASREQKSRTPTKSSKREPLLPALDKTLDVELWNSTTRRLLSPETQCRKTASNILARTALEEPTKFNKKATLSTEKISSTPSLVTSRSQCTVTAAGKTASLELQPIATNKTQTSLNIPNPQPKPTTPVPHRPKLFPRKLITPELQQKRSDQFSTATLSGVSNIHHSSSREQASEVSTNETLSLEPLEDKKIFRNYPSSTVTPPSKFPKITPGKHSTTTTTPKRLTTPPEQPKNDSKITKKASRDSSLGGSRIPLRSPRKEPRANSPRNFSTPSRQCNAGRAVRASPNTLNRLNEQDPAFQRALEAFGWEPRSFNTKGRAQHTSSSHLKSKLPIRTTTNVDELKATSADKKDNSETGYTTLFKRFARRG